MQFLVGRDCPYDTLKTFFNILFVWFNIFLILYPWRTFSFSRVKESIVFVRTMKKCLYPVLYINWFIAIIVGLVIYILMPDVSEFKANDGYLDLYEQVPGFALLLRTGFIIQNMGLLGIPIVFYYASRGRNKDAVKAGILSASTLFYSFATYSRAGIVSFAITFLAYYFLIKKTLPSNFNRKFEKFVKKTGLVLIVGFSVMTFVRFSAMTYYGDRIPKNSIIKDPIVFSIVDYVSQSNNNGLICLENYTSEKCLYGESFFMNELLVLNSFGIIHWDKEAFRERAEKAYSGLFIMFNGYVASSVIEFGYVFTLLFDFFLCVYICRALRKKGLSVKTSYYLVMLLQIPLNSIYYNSLSSMIFPFILVFFASKLSSIRALK